MSYHSRPKRIAFLLSPHYLEVIIYFSYIIKKLDTNIYKMKYTHILLVLAIAALLIGCNQKNTEPDINRFAGLWSLLVMEQQDSVTGEWSEWRNGMQGYILYDDKGDMAVHLTTKGYEDTDLQFPNFVDTLSTEALKYLTNSYVYFAKYTVDKKQNVVEHARISHSNPGMWNEVVIRRFSFSGDTLTLQPLEKETARLRLKWIKESVSNIK